MENKKSSKISLSTFFLIIAVIVIVAMAFYIYIDKTNSDVENATVNETIKDMQNTIKDLQEEIKSDNETINDTSTTNATNETKNSFAVLELSPIGGTAVLYKGEVYVNVYDSTLNIDNVYGDGKFQTLMKTRESYTQYEFDSLTIDNNSKKWSKLNISNVKAIYNNEYGQATSSTNPKYGILMLNDDNTVSYISISDLIEGKTETIKFNANNITTIETEDNNGLTTYLVDNDGNKKDVNTYIKLS